MDMMMTYLIYMKMKMISRPIKYILVDTGFWIALIGASDQKERIEKAQEYYEAIKHKTVIFPWPTYYELLRDKFFKHTYNIEKFKKAARGLKIQRIYDDDFRDEALKITMNESTAKNKISLFDNIIKLIILNKNIKTDALVTFNRSDFNEICSKNSVEIWD